jgi:hypothetical protein
VLVSAKAIRVDWRRQDAMRHGGLRARRITTG